MRTSHALLIAGVLAGCGGGSKPPPATPPPPTSPVEAAPMTWLEGTYGGDAGGAGTGTLHVHASEGALYAVWLGNEQARVWIFDEEGDVPALHAWSYTGIGGAPTERVFKIMSEGERVAAFGDASTLLTLRRAPSGGLVLSEAGTPSPFLTGELAPIAAAPAATLEDADRAFAADSLARGADAWAASVAADGALFRRGAAIVGPDAVKEMIGKTLAAIDLRWEPVASGLSANRTFGFTVGKATWTSRGDDSEGRGSYVTIWEVQPDGTARWIFDTGR